MLEQDNVIIYEPAIRYGNLFIRIDILVKRGHQFDLIEVKAGSDTQLEVQLRNPEHDITRAIKQVLRNYQAGGNLFATVTGDLEFTGYITADESLPEALGQFRGEVEGVLAELEQQAGGGLTLNFVDPGAPDSELGVRLAQDYGFRPMATSLFDQDTFYFYMTLAEGDTIIQIPLDDMTREAFERNLKAAIKRFSSGFTRTVAMVLPEASAAGNPYAPPSLRFSQLESFIGGEMNIQREDLSDGSVSGDADVLMLLAPAIFGSAEPPGSTSTLTGPSMRSSWRVWPALPTGSPLNSYPITIPC